MNEPNIINNVENNRSYPTINRINRQLFNNGREEIDEFAAYSYSQGFDMVGNMVYQTLISIQENFKFNNLAKIVIYDITSNEIHKEVILDIGHANSITVNENKKELYIAECYRYNSDNTKALSNKIFVIDIETLFIKESYNVLGVEALASCTYDKITKKLYCNYETEVYELNDNFEVVDKIILPEIEFEYIMQTINIFGNKIFKTIYNPNALLEYNIKGQLVKIYNFNSYSSDGYYIGEFEDFTVIDNDIYITTSLFPCNSSGYNMSQIFNINIKTDQISKNKSTNNTQTIKKYIVDNNSICVNPDGSKNKPFKEVFEVIPFINNSSFPCEIKVLKAENRYSFLYLTQINNVRFTAEVGVEINGIRCNKISNVFINNFNIGYNKAFTIPLKIIESSVTINNCIFNNTIGKFNNSIELANSELTITGTFKGVDNICDIVLNSGSKLNNKFPINLDFRASDIFLNPNKYIIAKDLERIDIGDRIPLNICCKNNFNKLKSIFKYINFDIIYLENQEKTITIDIDADKYKFYVNCIDDYESLSLLVYSIELSFDSSGELYFKSSKCANINEKKYNEISNLKIKTIWLSN